MAITDPTVNPTISQTTAAQTTAPDWYNNFLSGLASSGQQAVQQGGAAGPSTLQTAAYNQAPTAITAGQPALNMATQSAANVAGTPTSSLVNQYMDPYTNSVINSIGQLGTTQYNELLAPAANAAAVGSGQFGSTRGQTVQADVARDVSNNITAQQAQALNTQYNNAIAAAQNQQALGLNTANTLGNLSNQASSQGISGLNALSGLGAQQQATTQAQLNYPMTALQNYGQLMSGLNIPTGTTQTTTGPAGSGQLGPSALSQILGVGSTLGSISNTSLGTGLGNYLMGTSAVGTPGTAGYKAATTGALGSLGTGLSNIGTSIGNYLNPTTNNFTGPVQGASTTTINPDGSQTTTSTDINGNNINYNSATGSWTNASTGEVVASENVSPDVS